MKSKKMTALGLAAGLVAGAGAGLILEMSGTAGASSAVVSVSEEETDTTDSGTTDTATSEDRAAQHAERLAEVLQPLVDDGTLTADQMDAVVEALAAAGPMGGPGGHGGRGGHGIEVVAETLGLTAEEIRTAIQGGQTIADLAAANGSSGQAVIDAMVAEVSAHLDEKVAAGDLTAEEAATKLAEATEKITEFVNNTPEPPAGGRGGRGPGAPADDASE